MALVKKTKISPDAAKPVIAPPNRATPSAKTRQTPSMPRNQSVAERLAAATEELASGLTQSAAATKELSRSMEQIAGGAEEAAGASQEQSAAIKRIVANLATARTEADASARRSDAILGTLTEAGAMIGATSRAIERNAERRQASVAVISELERRANDIGEITKTVSRISDQTNLLALNAAIEAARAGDHGRGFAVVADEVRTLAEISDKSALEVQQLSQSIQSEVVGVVEALKKASDSAVREAKAASAVLETLEARREDMLRISEGNRDILTAAMEAERAAVEAEKGAEQIASAAEEQSSGASEAQTAVQQQAKSLEQSQVAAQALAVLAEDLRTGKGGAAAAEQISSSSEQLSATIQELSSAASQVMAAVEEINRASQMQASATQQTSAALAQIEKSAKLAQENGKAADARVHAIEAALKQGRASIEGLIEGVGEALKSTQSSATTVGQLETVGRKIEKIVNSIALITVQTSMLAVSGSVEAARSGDAGRGFAVVSSDIRNLAREASDNVESAKDTVRGILDQIAILQRDLNQLIVSAEVEVQNNRSVSGSLQTIVSEVEALGKASRAIVEGSEAILQAAGETAAGSRQIATAAEEASNASREAATAAAEQSQGAEDLAAAIEEIGSLADELKQQNA
jgi:methyl-accepting chemotaxis protein